MTVRKALILICLILIFPSFGQSYDDAYFEHLTVADGLFSSNVSCITQDNNGLLWIGTSRGLNFYDGIQVGKWIKRASDSRHIIGKNVSAILFDENKIYLGIGIGFFVYDFNTNQLDRYKPNSSNPKNSVTCIFKDSNNNIWVGLRDGLCQFIKKNKTYRFKQYKTPGNDKLSSINFVKSINEDKNNTLWITTFDGLWIYKPEANNFIKASIKNNLPPLNYRTAIIDLHGNLLAASGNTIYRIKYDIKKIPEISLHPIIPSDINITSDIHTMHQSSDGVIWFSTLNEGGLYELQLPELTNKSIKIAHYSHSRFHQHSLSFNEIYRIYSDNNQIIWIATWGGGVSKLDRKTFRFSNIQPNEYNPRSIPLTKTTAMAADSYDNLWIAFRGNELLYRTPAATDFERFHHPILESNHITSLKSTSSGIIFASINGTKGGLVRFTIPKEFSGKKDVHKIKVEVFNQDNINDWKSKHNNAGACIEITDKKNIWYGSYNGGLVHFDFSENSINPGVKQYKYKNTIQCLLEDNNDRLWVGSDILYEFDKTSGRFKSAARGKPIAIHLLQDSLLCVGTNNGGLRIYDLNLNDFDNFIKLDNIGGVSSIIEDENSNLWLGTQNGLLLYSISNNKSYNFSVHDGLCNFQYQPRAACQGASGYVYFGGHRGIDKFKTSDFYNIPDFQSKVVFTKITINGTVYHQLHKGNNLGFLNNSNKISLTPDHEQISIHFADLNYSNSTKRKYKYRISNLNFSWKETDAQSAYAVFGNLKSGNYQFEVLAGDTHGNWDNTPAKITIEVKPHFHESWMFRIAVILCSLLFVYGIYLLRINQLKRQKRVLELKVDERTKKWKDANRLLEEQKVETLKQKDAFYQMKMKFFTNISHEFRTPVTLLKGPIEKVISSGYDKLVMKKYIRIVLKNIEILLQLVNEIMDFRKLETGHTQLMAEEINLGNFVKEVSDGFLSYATNKNIQFIAQCDDNYFIWADSEKLSKIIYNILSNAFKFTPTDGRILVHVSSSPIDPNADLLNSHAISSGKSLLVDYVEVMIEDSGIGVSSDSIKDIFERYYQTDNTAQHLGSGIGLALAKQLILLHKADVVVSSQRNKGTRFSIRFAKGNAHLTSNEIQIPGNELAETKFDLKDNIERTQTTINKESNIDSNISILIIEDNDDLREFLKDIFSFDYKVIMAKNGKEGLDMSLEHIPDIILSDVMMPEMNGIELCNKLKTDVNTSHIPIVLLTARSSIEHQQEGLQTGADAYIPKPFDEKILKMQINNLVSTRLNNIQKAQNSNNITTKELTSNETDKNFIINANQIILRELSNSDFRMEDLSREIGMSYKSFQRKLKALTGNTPGEFIRAIRLNAASELLLNTKLSISEIAFKTGFYDVSHFGKLFREKFDMSASKYRTKYS